MRRSALPVANPWPRSVSGCDALATSCSRTPVKGQHADADVVVVSHVSPIKAAVAWALGTGDEVVWHLYLATASITRIGWGNAGPVLHRYNETPFSELTRGLRPPA